MEKPTNIPGSCEEHHKNIMPRHKKHVINPYLTYEQARNYVLTQISPPPTSRAQYWLWYDQHKPSFLPKRPDKVFCDFSWNRFLNTTNSFEKTVLNNKGSTRTYRNMWEAVRYAQGQAKLFELSTQREWEQFCDDYDVPDDIPKRPHHAYDNFPGYGVWLGKDAVAHLTTAKEGNVAIVGLHHAAGYPANCVIVKVWKNGVIECDESGTLGQLYKAYRLEKDTLPFIESKLIQYGTRNSDHWVVENINQLWFEFIDLLIVKVG